MSDSDTYLEDDDDDDDDYDNNMVIDMAVYNHNMFILF